MVRSFTSLIVVSTLVLSCNLEGIDTKKTGISRRSQSLKSSIDNGVFKYELCPNSNLIPLNSDSLFLVNAWVETGWSYESINGDIEIVKRQYDNVILNFKDFDLNKYDDYNVKINGSNFGWNGVLFNTLKTTQDTLEIVFNNAHTNERLHRLQLVKGKCR